MQPDEASFLFEFLLPQLSAEKEVTKKIILSVPPGKEDYRPAAKSMSALELARHLAFVEIWFLDAVIRRHFGETTDIPEEVETCSEVAEWYEQSFARRIPLLEALSGDDLATPVDYLGLRNDPAVAYLNIAIRHSVHHRGQLSAYLRPMGAKVPAIYVESADEPYPPEAGSTSAGTEPPPAF